MRCAQDSPASSAENLRSVENPTTAAASPAAVSPASPVDDSKDLQTDASHRQPLITSSSDSKKPASSSSSSRKDRESAVPPAGDDAADRADEDLETSDATSSLMGKNVSSHASLDSYDRTKNPFFAN